jgi:hypothetical protein
MYDGDSPERTAFGILRKPLGFFQDGYQTGSSDGRRKDFVERRKKRIVSIDFRVVSKHWLQSPRVILLSLSLTSTLPITNMTGVVGQQAFGMRSCP